MTSVYVPLLDRSFFPLCAAPIQPRGVRLLTPASEQKLKAFGVFHICNKSQFGALLHIHVRDIQCGQRCSSPAFS